jgi:hypothetical protein
VVLRRITITHCCFSLVWAIALNVSAAATASPRDPFEIGVSFATGPASVHSQNFGGARYRTIRGTAAASNRGALTTDFARRHRHQNRSKAVYRSGDHSVAQISPTILRRMDLSLEDDVRPPCAAKASRRSACYRARPSRPKSLTDALLEAPSPATEQILKDIGIPAIKDVPPIAILRAGHPSAGENFTTELP